jgi:hypothetical protein
MAFIFLAIATLVGSIITIYTDNETDRKIEAAFKKAGINIVVFSDPAETSENGLKEREKNGSGI